MFADVAIAADRASIHLKDMMPSEMNLDPNLPPLVHEELVNFDRCTKQERKRQIIKCVAQIPGIGHRTVKSTWRLAETKQLLPRAP